MHRHVIRLSLAVTFVMSLGAPALAQVPYRNPRLPVDVRVRDLLGRMTLDEKFWQLFMIPGGRENPADDYSRGVFGLQDRHAGSAREDAALQNSLQHYFVDSTRLGIPIIPFEEGVHGVMRGGATVFPAAIALAATFDSILVSNVAADIAREARARGIRQLLSPVVNLATDVRWGRVEETYGEDPYLASVMARAYVRSLEQSGVVATPKHFVANIGEGGRDSYPVETSKRALEQRYFPPFRAAIVDAGARSLMTAYNSVNGVPASQSHSLLTETLDRDWKFRGFVISDQAAVGGSVVLHHTEASMASATVAALEAGLDVIFQSGYDQHRPFLDAFRRGLIPPSVVDSAVARVLRVKFELGLFDHPYIDRDSVARWDDVVSQRALAREAAARSVVLLRNRGATLPLRVDIGSLAVIGTDAAEARLGGYTFDGARGVSILDGMRERFGARIRYAPGPGRRAASSTIIPPGSLDSLRGDYFDNIALTGRPRLSRRDTMIDFHWTFNAPAPGLAIDWYSVRWTGVLHVPLGGAHRLGVEGTDGYRLYLDDKLIIDDWRKQSEHTTLVPMELVAGSTHRLRLEFFESAGSARVRLVWDAGVPNDWRSRIDSAVAIARESDAAIVVAGIEGGEFRDRASLALPGHQEELIQRVAATGKPTVVVLVGGSAVTMRSWVDSVGAVLMAWYPGVEGGRAIADVLSGSIDPAGRLPITFPVSEGQLPLYYDHEPTGRGDDYVDLTGKPEFPFGFGLSYTHFEYDSLRIDPNSIGTSGRASVTFTIRNVGMRSGDEVPQLYIRSIVSPEVQPVLALKAFARVHLEAGAARRVTFTLDPRALTSLDQTMHWTVEPGTRRILVGASSSDIRLRGDLVVH